MLFLMSILFGAMVNAQQPAPIIQDLPSYTLFVCNNGGQLRVFSYVDRGVVVFDYADSLFLLRGTLQQTPNSNAGGIFDYTNFPSQPNQLGNYQYNQGVLNISISSGPANCFASRSIDITEL